jgi:2-oxoglutarate ferredoxin oxidoreductase subunit beta
MANPDLLVIVAGGDGDGFSIGGGHVPHAIRRNPDLTYLVMDNQVYGLTKGQVSPTSPRGTKSHASAYGSIEEPVNPLLYALAYGANFVAQGVSADLDGLAKIIEEAIRYPGFAFVNIQSPCVTFGDPEKQLKTQKATMRNLQTEGHDTTNHLRAMELAEEYGKTLYTGVFYCDPVPPPTYGSQIKDRQQQLKLKAPIEALAKSSR